MNVNNSELTYRFKYTHLVFLILDLFLIVIFFCIPVYFKVNDVANSWLKFNANSWETVIFYILQAISISVFTALVLSLFYEYRLKKEEKEENLKNIKSIFSENLEPLVINAILSDNNLQHKLINPKKLDEILLNCLSLKVNNPHKAKGIMDSLLNNVLSKDDTILEGLHVTLSLAKPEINKQERFKYEAYKMTYTIEYQTMLNKNNFMFMVTNDQSIQKKHLDPSVFCLFLETLNPNDDTSLEIKEAKIDGKDLVFVRKNKDKNFISYIYNDKGSKPNNKEKKISYMVAFLVRKNTHSFSYFAPFTTKNIHLTFDANNIDEIKRIRVWSYFNSSKEPIINYYNKENQDEKLNPNKIVISLDDWILPFSGATFTWQFERREKDDK